MKKPSIHTLGYSAIFTPAEEGGFVETFPDFPGCITQGDTMVEAKVNAVEVLELWIEELKSNGEPIPAHPQTPIISKIQVAV